jgi:hypothetical protein
MLVNSLEIGYLDYPSISNGNKSNDYLAGYCREGRWPAILMATGALQAPVLRREFARFGAAKTPSVHPGASDRS